MSSIHRQEHHGLTKTPVHNIWSMIKSRTKNPNSTYYKNYGGRGIKICRRWDDSLTAFNEDMGPRPTPKHSVDRKDADGHYSCGKCPECITNGWPANCRWTTADVQAWNRRKRINNTSGYIGVVRDGIQWRAQMGLTLEGYSKLFTIGRYSTPEEAALAYDKAAIFFRGEEAKTNFL